MIKLILASLIPFFILIYPISMHYELDPILISAQIKAESAFNPKARSHVGAIGLMQIMPSTAEWLGFIDKGEEDLLYNPSLNIRVGCYYDAWLRRYWRKKRWDGIYLDLLMLSSYNAGPGRTRRSISDHKLDFTNLPHETQSYVKRILQFRAEYMVKCIRKIADRKN